jgi:uncharacterized phage protein (TIGR02220 family)
MKTLREKHDELMQIIGENEAKRLLHNWYDRAIRRERKRANTVAHVKDPIPFCRQVLEDLQQRTGIEYRLGKNTQTIIIARKNEGFTIEDFKHVNEVKTRDWLEDALMRVYLVPATLYRASKFEKYLNQYNIWQRDIEIQKEKSKKKKEKRSLHFGRDDEEKPSTEEAARMSDIIQNTIKNLGKKKRMKSARGGQE